MVVDVCTHHSTHWMHLHDEVNSPTLKELRECNVILVLHAFVCDSGITTFPVIAAHRGRMNDEKMVQFMYGENIPAVACYFCSRRVAYNDSRSDLLLCLSYIYTLATGVYGASLLLVTGMYNQCS